MSKAPAKHAVKTAEASKRESTELSTVAAKDTNITAEEGWEDYERAGMENVVASDLMIPRLAILQALSPQLNKNKSEFIEGAEQGHIVDVGTGEVFSHPINFLPVFYVKQWLEWFPRKTDKGLAAIHKTDAIIQQCTMDEKNRPILPNQNYIAETAQWFGFNLSVPDRRRCFIPMASSQLKRSRQWMTLADSQRVQTSRGEIRPPLFYRSYTLSTGPESNAEGDWFGWRIERGETLGMICSQNRWDFQAMRLEADKFRRELLEGQARANLADLERSAASEESM